MTATRRATIGCGDPPVPRPENWSAYITVTQGKPYYIQAIGVEFGGGDNTAVAAHFEGDPDFADGDVPIPGSMLSPITVPTTATVVGQPKDAAVLAGSAAVFTVAVALPPTATVTSTKWQLYTGITGGTVADLTGAPKFPASPDEVRVLTSAEGPVDILDNYGSRISGFVTPAETGNYVFFIASDDGGELWLSTDDNPTNKKLIAQEASWSKFSIWNAPG